MKLTLDSYRYYLFIVRLLTSSSHEPGELGGGIAINISLKRKGVDVYVFNTSPHFFWDGDIEENNRQSVVEYGEVNKVLRALLPEATQKYTSLDCISKGNPIYQHAQIKLASCLTKIAAIDSPEIKILWQNENAASR